jgi:hypothetical protein
METQGNTGMTNSEFKALARYSNGRIKNFPEVAFDLTDAQIKQLHGDDYSYFHELKEECMYEISLMMG